MIVRGSEQRGATSDTGEAPAPRAMISGAVASFCADRFGARLQSIVLTGSLARDEATFTRGSGRWHLHGDAEFLVVFGASSALPPHTDMRTLARAVEDELARNGVVGHVVLASVHPSFLARLRPHIFAYELRACGQVVWGASHVLSRIPPFAASQIPLEDAWRLLCNRTVEFLPALAETIDGGDTASPALHYRTVKLYLDMATSLLLFAGTYVPTYRGRREALRRLVHEGQRGDWPFPMEGFARQVDVCTEWKLTASSWRGPEPSLRWQDAWAYASRLLRWELRRLIGGDVEIPDEAAFQRWMQCEPLAQRLRGWLYVVRQSGWHRSWRSWIRWLRLARSGSPRYSVYAAADRLLSGFSSVTPGATEVNHWADAHRFLPCCGSGVMDGAISWRHVAADIFWNYEQFLVRTRA